MKKYWKGFLLFALLCLGVSFAACGKDQIEPNTPMQEIMTEYQTDGYVSTFAAAEDGTVYIVCLEPTESMTLSGYRLYRFDTAGERTGDYTLENYFQVMAMDVGEDSGTVYFTGEDAEMGLYRIDTETGEVEGLCKFPYFRQVKKVVRVGRRVYVLGQKLWGFSYGGENEYDFSNGEKIVYYDIDTGEVYELGFEFPINMASDQKGHLVVVGYLESDGYCMMEYDPKIDNMQVKERLGRFLFDNFAVCNDGNSLLYSNNSNQFGLLMADYGNLEIEVEVYEEARPEGIVCYAGGRVYCMDNLSERMVGFPLSGVRRENRTMRLISCLGSFAPYGCGYALERVDMAWDQIVLKTLAQDQDYDLCIGTTYESSSQVMKDSDSFYPLNDIPGIEEYFDRCFPYIKEAATREDGTIWMLPFMIVAPGLMMKEDELAEAGIPIHQNITYPELAEIVHGFSEQQKKQVFLPMYLLSRYFIDQYLTLHSMDLDSRFMEYMGSLKQLYLDLPFGLLTQISNDLLVQYVDFGRDAWLERRYINNYKEAGYQFSGLPAVEGAQKNTMFCYFIAVNPNSSRLQETLSYIADLAAYLTAQETAWYFQDYQAEPGSLEEQIYHVIENGEIIFSVDGDVYLADMERAFLGEISLEEYVRDVERKLRIYRGE